jgi:hypothetical protein
MTNLVVQLSTRLSQSCDPSDLSLGEPPVVVYPDPLPVHASSVVKLPRASLTVCTFDAAADTGGGGPSDYAVGYESAYVKVGDPTPT